MQIQDFIREYETKSNQELLLLAIDPSQLADEANSALWLELHKRRLGSREIQNFQEQQRKQQKKGERQVGELWFVSHFGLGKKRIGKVNYKYYDVHKVEEFTTTIFFLVLWFPLIPVGTYRIRRQKSLFANRFSVVAKPPLDWSHVMRVWAVA